MRPVCPHAPRRRSVFTAPMCQNGSSLATHDRPSLCSTTQCVFAPNDDALSYRMPTCAVRRLFNATCHCPINPTDRCMVQSWPPDVVAAPLTVLFELTARPSPIAKTCSLRVSTSWNPNDRFDTTLDERSCSKLPR